MSINREDVYAVIGIIAGTIIAWRLIDLAEACVVNGPCN